MEIGRITIDDLPSATGCWLINSVAGSIPAILDLDSDGRSKRRE